MGELMGDDWIYRIDIKGLSDDVRREIVKRVKDKLGYSGALEALGIARGSLFNYLHGIRRVPDDVIRKALHYLDEPEFNRIVQGFDRLRAVGIVREDGSIDYSLILQAVALASRDEYLKQAILRFAVEHFKEDLRRMLGLVPTTIKLTWDKGFEEFLRERKKRRRITTEDTLEYYRNLFKKHLEGKVLSQDLIDYVINYPVKWLRNVFRHYIQYLYYTRKISPETYGWIMEIVPSRSYRMDVRSYPVNTEDLVKTISTLRDSHKLYHLVYRLMLEGGLRLSHAIYIIESFNPNEVIEINGLDIETPRLVCFEDKGFCRYYVGLRESVKPCEWAYLSIDTLRLLREYSGISIDRRTLTKYVKRRDLLLPKYVRKIAWRLMIKAMPREVARFIQSRFGELKISEARYEDLLSEADQHYSKYLEKLWEELMAN
ncbi:MAG: integrase [Desulfurococcales archaeon]|jgi:intergrase/recombinase|nr:integrase [Desulfurococcales archaeon]